MRRFILVRIVFFGVLLFMGAALLSGAGGTARAASFSFTGSFAKDNDVQLFNFILLSAATVTLRTYSYAGGTNSAGTSINQGGFDPILALFNASGVFISENDDGTTSQVGTDSNTNEGYDSYFQTGLGPGIYTVALTQFDNSHVSTGLGYGFAYSGGDPFFTATFGCSNGQFCDISSAAPYNNRTSQWAFDVLNADQAVVLSAVPLPASLPLFLTGLAGLGLAGRRRRKGNNPAA